MIVLINNLHEEKKGLWYHASLYCIYVMNNRNDRNVTVRLVLVFIMFLHFLSVYNLVYLSRY